MENNEGIIISSIDYKEKSKIVYLYTPYGHTSVRANGGKTIKNGLLGFTTTGNVVTYLKTNGQFPAVVEYSIKESFFDLTESIPKADVLFKFFKIIKEIPEDSDHQRIYPFVIKMLNELKNTENPQKILAIFLIKMLGSFGIAPNLRSCILCGNKDKAFFSLDDGGIYCHNCHVENEVSLEKLKIWDEYYYKKAEIDNFSEYDFVKLLDDIYLYYKNHIDLKLK